MYEGMSCPLHACSVFLKLHLHLEVVCKTVVTAECNMRLLFVFSDFVLALEMFVLREGTWVRVVTSLTVWATYWMAQTMLLTGLVL